MMDKEQKDKVLLLSIVTFLQFAGIVKERSNNFRTDKIEASRSFFNELMNYSAYIHGLWSDYFKEQDIFSFSDNLLQYQETAHNIAIGMDKSVKNYTSHNLNTQLAHLISKITLKKSSSVKALPFKKFDYEAIFPLYENGDKIKAQEYYKEAYNNILKGTSKIIMQAEKDNNLFAVSAALDSLFFENLSNIPAFLGNDIVDISLYEYAKIVAAYTSILFIQPESFALIRGDFFSIQNFIFNKGASNKNPAKSLRGKSFYVSLMSDIASLYILEELGLSYFNIMMNAAGQFEIVSYHNKDAETAIEKVEKNIYNWLYEKFYCSVSLKVSYIKCSEKDFSKKGFSKLRLKILYQKDISKLTRFNLVEKDEFIFKDYHKKFKKDTSLCVYCGVDTVDTQASNDGSKDVCKNCYSYIELGEKLTKEEYINIYHDDKGIFNRYNYAYDNNYRKDAVHRMHINLLKEEKSGYNCCNVVHYSSYVVRNDNGDIRSFDDIVKYGSGAEILAVLKADVDNLGLVFSCGLSKKDDKYNVIDSEITFSKTNMLSRSIHNFFSYFLSSVMEKEKLNIYTVFAGGDDLFIVGKYNDIIKFAKILNDKFKEFTGNNK
ncbi:MAG: type III-A CRISPR-associated protein Cas10/Csm1, partial [Mucispirillum sp.]|nr:type III-A CRISPR-associated protein Cas10/Csm1 [Mucispirillum sp.]